MIKTEIAETLGVPLDTVGLWADKFVEWFDVDSRWIHKTHDEKDYTIFHLINELNRQIGDEVSFVERMGLIERGLRSSQTAMSIRLERKAEKARPEIARWELVSTLGFSLIREYEWLMPLGSSIDSIADFGCWATEGETCSEPYALLWSLGANRVIVIEKNPEHIQNAREWLEITRKKHPFFENYNVTFAEDDMTSGKVAEQYANEFNLSFCRNVLYNMQKDLSKIQEAITTMKAVLKPGGWLVAIEGKIGGQYKEVQVEITSDVTFTQQKLMNEPTDIGYLFEAEGWEKIDLPNAPDWSYCYRRKSEAS